MAKKHKVLMTALVVGLAGVLGGFGVFAAFSSTTTNPGNTFQAGSVVLGDNDGGSALFNAGLHGNTKPGNYDRCIRVSYSGSLPADVKLYTSAITGDGNGMNVTVHKAATGTAADCSDFARGADGVAGGGDDETPASVFAAAPLTSLDDHSSFSNGLEVDPIGTSNWTTGSATAFRLRITVGDNDQNATLDAFDVKWEAQNQ